MNVTSAVARVQRGLGFRGTTFKVDEIKDELESAQRHFEAAETLPWFLIEEDATLSLSSGTATVALPTGFISEVDDDGPHYTNSNNTLVYPQKMDYNEGVRRFVSSSAAGPTAYCIRKSNFYFWPTPDTAYTLTYSYYKKADDASTESTTAWLDNVPDLIIGKAGLMFAGHLRDKTAVELFTGILATGLAELNGLEVRREQGNRQYALGRNL